MECVIAIVIVSVIIGIISYMYLAYELKHAGRMCMTCGRIVDEEIDIHGVKRLKPHDNPEGKPCKGESF